MRNHSCPEPAIRGQLALQNANLTKRLNDALYALSKETSLRTNADNASGARGIVESLSLKIRLSGAW